MVHQIKNKLYFLLLLIFCTSCTSTIHKKKNNALSLNEVTQDFTALTEHIEKDVPHPFYTCPKNCYDSVKKIVADKLHDSMSVVELYRMLYPLIQILNDAHFSIQLPNNYNKEVDRTLYFPCKIILSNNQVFIYKNLSSNIEIKSGDEIISINGIPVKSIMEKIRSSNFKSTSEENFFERFNEYVFSYRLNSLFGFNTKFSIQTKNKKKINLTGILEERFLKENKSDDSPYTFSILASGKNKIGYLKIASLVEQQKSLLDSLLKSYFKKIKENYVQYLIIDIRDNLGGSSVLAKNILDYITAKPYTLAWGEEYLKDGKLFRNIDSTLNIPAQNEYRFWGETILLTNVLSYSSAHMMDVGFNYYHLGKTVGQMSSEPLFITGEVQSIVLPNSKCLFYYPSSNFILPGFDRNKKCYFIPDYEIYPSIKNQLNNKDTLLNFAVKLFEHNTKP